MVIARMTTRNSIRIVSFLAQTWAVAYVLYWLVALATYWTYNLITRNVAYVSFIEPNSTIALYESLLFIPAISILIAMMVNALVKGIASCVKLGRT